MPSADVKFDRNEDEVAMTLQIDGKALLVSRSYESIVRELQLGGARRLTIDGLFSTELPTSERTLAEADPIAFAEPMPALRLIAACSALGEAATLPSSERRARPRAMLNTAGGTSAAAVRASAPAAV